MADDKRHQRPSCYSVPLLQPFTSAFHVGSQNDWTKHLKVSSSPLYLPHVLLEISGDPPIRSGFDRITGHGGTLASRVVLCWQLASLKSVFRAEDVGDTLSLLFPCSQNLSSGQRGCRLQILSFCSYQSSFCVCWGHFCDPLCACFCARQTLPAWLSLPFAITLLCTCLLLCDYPVSLCPAGVACLPTCVKVPGPLFW